MKKIVVFSLFGNDPRYIEGTRDNIAMFNTFYPGWEMRIYYASDLDDSVKDMIKAPSFTNAIEMSPSVGLSGTYWRFMAIDEPDSIVVSRDIDSRPILRDAIAVNHWLTQTNAKAHIIYDHPFHYKPTYPIYAGMFGIRGGLNKPITPRVLNCLATGIRYGSDQLFLASEVYPEIVNDVVIFDGMSMMKKDPRALEIPHYRTDYNFIGETYFDGKPCPEGVAYMKNILKVN